MDEELVDIRDEQGNILRQELKSEAHKHGWLHATVIGCLCYGDDWALVQQSPDRQDAGQYVNPVGGHVKAGETYEQALLREASEEIGTNHITHRFIGSGVYRRTVLGRDENHLFMIYEITTPDEVVLGPEAVAIRTFTSKELRELASSDPQLFGDAYYFTSELFFPELLPANWHQKHAVDKNNHK